jgi:hypothetical protein
MRPGSEKKVKARASSLRKRKAVSRSSQISQISGRQVEATVKRFCLKEVGGHMRTMRMKPAKGTNGCSPFQRTVEVLAQQAATNSENAETPTGPES